MPDLQRVGVLLFVFVRYFELFFFVRWKCELVPARGDALTDGENQKFLLFIGNH